MSAAAADRFRVLAQALGVNGGQAAAVADGGDPAAVLAAFTEIAGGDVKTSVEVLWAGASAVLPMVSTGMSPARKASVLRAFAARLLVEADVLHRPGEAG